MLYSFILMLIFTIVILVSKNKNKHYLLMGVMFFSIAGASLAMVLYVNKLSDFRTLFFADRQLYLLLLSLRINFYDMVRLFDWFNILFLYSMGLFSVAWEKKRPFRDSLWRAVILAVPALVYVFINDPETLYTLYLMKNTGGGTVYDVLSAGRITYNYAVIAFYIGITLVKLWREWRRYRVWIVKRNTILTLGCLLLIDIFYIAFFVISPLGEFGSQNVDYLRFNISYPERVTYFTYFMPLMLVFLLAVLCVLLFKFQIFNWIDEYHWMAIKKRLVKINNEFYGLLHAQKNAFFAISLLAREGEETQGSTEKELFSRINNNAQQALENLSRMLDSLNGRHLQVKWSNLVDCIYSAIHGLNSADNIRISMEFAGERREYNTVLDSVAVTESLRNILANSVEAIQLSGKANGEISIYLYREEDWMDVRITDNGCGIARKSLRKVFKPMHSTKHTKNNWGMGLTYVNNIVKAHAGHVRVQSVENEFTAVEIALPVQKMKKGAYI